MNLAFEEVNGLSLNKMKLSLHPFPLPKSVTRKKKAEVARYILALPLDLRTRVRRFLDDEGYREDLQREDKRRKDRERMRLQREEEHQAREEERLAARRTVQTADSPGCYLELPTEQERLDLHRDYIKKTGNEALKHAVCLSCARWLPFAEGEELQLSQVPNSHLLKPSTEELCMRSNLKDGLLLATEHIYHVGEQLAEGGWWCDPCLRHLRQGKKIPPLALANNMWIGPQPKELTCLSMSEQLLIARAFPRCYVYKLYPKDGGHRPDSLQRGMKGNVTSYAMNTNDVAHMVDGALYPHKPSILPSLIGVCFMGRGALPRNWLKETFGVRRALVRKALQWLKSNNPLYDDIEISEDNLDLLPEDGVPEEIELACREENDAEIAAREAASYVPDEFDDDDRGIDEGKDLTLPERRLLIICCRNSIWA